MCIQLLLRRKCFRENKDSSWGLGTPKVNAIGMKYLRKVYNFMRILSQIIASVAALRQENKEKYYKIFMRVSLNKGRSFCIQKT